MYIYFWGRGGVEVFFLFLYKEVALGGEGRLGGFQKPPKNKVGYSYLYICFFGPVFYFIFIFNLFLIFSILSKNDSICSTTKKRNWDISKKNGLVMAMIHVTITYYRVT